MPSRSTQASYNKTAHIEATLTVTAEGKNYDFVTTYQTVTLVAKTVFEGTLEPISFKFEEGLDKTFSIDEIAECVGIDKALLTSQQLHTSDTDRRNRPYSDLVGRWYKTGS